MSDRRRKIEALRAKAESTTFPAEAAALRAKADELAAQEPSYTPPSGINTGAAADWITAKVQPNVTYENIRFHGNFFHEMGGITVNVAGFQFKVPPEKATNRVQVTDVNGRTYWIIAE